MVQDEMERIQRTLCWVNNKQYKEPVAQQQQMSMKYTDQENKGHMDVEKIMKDNQRKIDEINTLLNKIK